LIADGTIIGVGLLSKPVQFDIFGGKITRLIRRKKPLPSNRFEKGEGEIFGIAELGLGVNEFVTEFDGGFEDKKIFGGAHIGVGGNLDLGGEQSSTVHLDIILRKVSLKLDKKWLLEEGKLAQKI
jgi:leucyl aminopeptidase (aminopeptidase T)